MRVRGTCASGARVLGLRVERGGDMLLRVRSEVRQVEDASLHQPVFPRQGSQGQHRRQRQVGPAELVACLSICLSMSVLAFRSPSVRGRFRELWRARGGEEVDRGRTSGCVVGCTGKVRATIGKEGGNVGEDFVNALQALCCLGRRDVERLEQHRT